MPSTATGCSWLPAPSPTYKCSAGGGSLEAAAGIPAAGPCRWRTSSSDSFPVISFDPAKRLWTLQQRGLDFVDAERVFAGRTLEFQDVRRDYGEDRTVCLGLLQGRIVVIVYTKRTFYRYIISMRKANARAQRRFRDYVS